MSARGKIKIISASAGSGKTTCLARLLEEAVVSGRVRPDAVVATTFTRKAAAELQERTRRQLLAAGRVSDAHRLAAARIGTVNGICDRLVSEFAFELGLPPRLRVLEERRAAEHLSRAMTASISSEIAHELATLRGRMNDFDWPQLVRRTIEAYRSNGFSSADLEDFAERSVEDALGLFDRSQPTGDAGLGRRLDEQLASALSSFIQTRETGDDHTKTTGAAVERARRELGALQSKGEIPWGSWASLARLQVAKASREAVEPLHAAAAAHDRHPRLQRDIERAIRLVFEVTRRTLDTYAALKRSWGVIDFVDQEVYARQLLGRPDVRDRLREQVDLVLVDEFQDTSPLQLTLFVQLAEIAPASVWVGDQKQAIFGFRGTDPVLMSAALEEFVSRPDPTLIDRVVSDITRSKQLDTLSISYRSRPELVRLTSDIFAGAFAAHDIPPERVRLEPATDREPAGLGPIVAFWSLRIPNQQQTTELGKPVASGVAALLESDERVRDPNDGQTRAIRPRDIAVLCRTNAQCGCVADALEALDIRAIVPRTGLFDTLEGRIALAALRLWLDPHDTVAAAEIDRVESYPDQPDAWLQTLLPAPGEDDAGKTSRAQIGGPRVDALRAARQKDVSAAALEALDGALEAVNLRELCARWGDAPRRWANLDAIRAHGACYVDESEAGGVAPTPAGLLAYLLRLTEEQPWKGKGREDDQAVLGDDDAVTVSTWHRAKGLEWPVTVLFGLERLRARDAIGVHVLGERESFDIDDPLGGRRIRVMPNPFYSNQVHAPFLERLRRAPVSEWLRREGRREALRLLYVGWTRARDRVVLASRRGKLFDGLLGTLREIDPALIDTPKPETTWAGRRVEIEIREVAPSDPPARVIEPGELYVRKPRQPYPPAVQYPSEVAAPLDGGSVLAEPEEIGEPVRVRTPVDPPALGSAIHGFLAADDPSRAAADRRAIAAALLDGWGVVGAIDVDALLAIADSLERWIATRWPKSARYKEWPLLHRLDTGTVVRGVPDVVLHHDSRAGVVDHKTILAAPDDAVNAARSYAPQLAAYRAGLQAALGVEDLVGYVHLPLAGMMVRLG